MTNKTSVSNHVWDSVKLSKMYFSLVECEKVFAVSGRCFTNDWWALQNILSKFLYYRYHTSDENFKSNFVRVPKAMLWAHVQSFGLKFSPSMWFLALYIFVRLFWRARKTLVKQPPGFFNHGSTRSLRRSYLIIFWDFTALYEMEQGWGAVSDLSLNPELSQNLS